MARRSRSRLRFAARVAFDALNLRVDLVFAFIRTRIPTRPQRPQALSGGARGRGGLAAKPPTARAEIPTSPHEFRKIHFFLSHSALGGTVGRFPFVGGGHVFDI